MKLERLAPFTIVLEPTELAAGAHALTAAIEMQDGQRLTVTSGFEVVEGEQSPVVPGPEPQPAPEPRPDPGGTFGLYTDQKDADGRPVSLDGALLEAETTVHVAPEDEVETAWFHLNDPRLESSPARRERLAPYTMPLDPSDIGDGTHQLTVDILRSDDTRTTVTARFHVVTGGSIGDTSDGADVREDPSTGERYVSARSYGAAGDGVTDDTAALQAALHGAERAGVTLRIPAGLYRLTAGLEVPDLVARIVLHDDAVLRQEADDHVLRKQGRVRPTEYSVTGGTERGSRTVTLAHTDGLEPGEWLHLRSDDLLHPNKGATTGFLRVVKAIDGRTVTLDKALHRPMTSDIKAYEVGLAKPLRIEGGVFENADPKTVFEPLVKFDLVRNPVLVGAELRDCGASAVRTTATVGGELDIDVHDCLDDHTGQRYGSGRHYGYGVEAAGATRSLKVRGTATRVRHAFTTNPAYAPPDRRLRLAGEPEEVTVSMDVWETTSSGLDTHEPGYKIAFVDSTVRRAGTYHRAGSTDGKEGGFGIFIRSRATIVRNVVVEGSADDGLVVAMPPRGVPHWSIADGPRISGLQVVDTEGMRGVHFHQPAQIDSFSIAGFHRIGVHVDRGLADSRVTNGTIDLQDYPDSFGVLNADATVLEGVTVTRAKEVYR